MPRTREEMARLRPNATPINTFQFGGQTVRTKVNVMVPADGAPARLDVTASMHGAKPARTVHLDLMMAGVFDGAKEQTP